MRGAERLFVERAGVFFQSEGLPRIGGRIFGLLLLEQEPLSIDAIARILRVSKPSVSTNTRTLERWGFLERVGRQGDRRSYYRLAPDLVHRTLFERVERMRRFRSLVEDARAQASTDHPALRRRLAELVTAYGQSIDALNRVLADWPTTRAS
jgi:DNA-binding transcriptional regulator GbsR (MarR family)